MDVFLVGLSASWKNTSVNCGDIKKKRAPLLISQIGLLKKRNHQFKVVIIPAELAACCYVDWSGFALNMERQESGTTG